MGRRFVDHGRGRRVLALSGLLLAAACGDDEPDGATSGGGDSSTASLTSTTGGPATTSAGEGGSASSGSGGDGGGAATGTSSSAGGGGGATPTCTDLEQNGDETGVDCGGPDCPACEIVEDADWYVAPDGSDDGPGTIEAPLRTWSKLSEVMVAGELAYIRGGTYLVDRPLDSDVQERLNFLEGEPDAPIRIFAFPGERPVLDFSDQLRTASPTGLYVQDASWVHLKGLRITGIAQNPEGGGVPCGFTAQRVTNATFERIEVDHIGGYGFALLDGAHDNLFLNCDAHHLADEYTGYENANGFNITGGVDATGNVFDGCRAWWACDDGFDLFGVDGFVTIRDSWSFWNGFLPDTFEPIGDGMGFKLGPTRSYCCGGPDQSDTLLRVVTRNAAFENAHGGFDQNGGLTRFELSNNTAFDNGETGFLFGYDAEIDQASRNNLSYGNGAAYVGAEIEGDHNTWNGVAEVGDADFASLSSVGVDGPRGVDGALPTLDFLRLAPDSDLVDAGVDVGLPFAGDAPDLGCFER